MASNRFLDKQSVSADEVKRMSESELLHIGLAGDQQYKRVNWHNAKLLVRTCLKSEECANVVRYILEYCRAEDGTTVLEMIDFSERVNIIAAYALVELPHDFEELYRLVYVSDLYDTVCNAVCTAQIEGIKRAVQIYFRES